MARRRCQRRQKEEFLKNFKEDLKQPRDSQGRPEKDLKEDLNKTSKATSNKNSKKSSKKTSKMKR